MAKRRTSEVTFTVEEAQDFVERAETMNPADVSWAELEAATTVLRSIARSSFRDGLLAKPWVDRIMAIVAAKAADAVEAVRDGSATAEDEGEISRAVNVAQATHRSGEARDPSATGFLAEVADARRDIELSTRTPRVEGPRGGRATESADDARRGRRRQADAVARQQLSSTNALLDLGVQAGVSDVMLQQALADFDVRTQFQGESPEQVIAFYRQQWLGEAIGVPPGFVATRHDPTDDATGGLEFWRERTGRDVPTRPRQVEPRFFAGDEYSPASLPFEERAELQQSLVEAGLLAEDDFWTGEWDDASVEAYARVLGYANRWGSTPEETMQRLARSLPESLRADASGSDAVFTPPAYLEPDYATLAQTVKATFRGQVGRDPTDAELSQFASQLGGYYRADYDADVAAQRATFDAAQAGEGASPGTFQDVDPAARFRELFEQKYKPEIDRLGALGDVQANEKSVFDSLRTMSSLIGGG